MFCNQRNMSIFNKNSETPQTGKSRHLLIKKTFFNMSKIKKVKPVLQRNGIKNSHPIEYQKVNKISLTAMIGRGETANTIHR